jgi:hypothetical protein
VISSKRDETITFKRRALCEADATLAVPVAVGKKKVSNLPQMLSQEEVAAAATRISCTLHWTRPRARLSLRKAA